MPGGQELIDFGSREIMDLYQEWALTAGHPKKRAGSKSQTEPAMANRIEVKIKKLRGCEDIPLPTYQSADSAAMDLHAAVVQPVVLEPGETRLIPCGFAIALPEEHEAQIRPRSGIASKHNVIIPNAPGTIDPDYRGEIKVALLNLGKQAFTIDRGMRIAQMIVAPFLKVNWIQAEDLPPTERGSGGFGHTGE
jgi:dUTP pyrophosphatase